MTDSEFLEWVAARFVNVLDESPNVDFVLRLRKLAKTGLMCPCNPARHADYEHAESCPAGRGGK